MNQSLDVVKTLRELGSELIDIGVELNEPYELVARIGAVSFMCHYIADAMDRELQLAAERGRGQTPSTRDSSKSLVQRNQAPDIPTTRRGY